MANRHVMTAKRRAALRKAQLASARKRRKAGAPQRKARRRAAARTVGRAARKGAKGYGTALVVGTALVGPSLTYRAGVRAPARAVGAAYHGGRGFSRGFKQGYSNSRARQRQTRHNMSRMGGTTIHRVQTPALPGGGYRNSRGGSRRVRGY